MAGVLPGLGGVSSWDEGAQRVLAAFEEDFGCRLVVRGVVEDQADFLRVMDWIDFVGRRPWLWAGRREFSVPLRVEDLR